MGHDRPSHLRKGILEVLREQGGVAHAWQISRKLRERGILEEPGEMSEVVRELQVMPEVEKLDTAIYPVRST